MAQQAQSEIILLCVRWDLSYPLSYRRVMEMVNERGLDVYHTTVFRWVQEYRKVKIPSGLHLTFLPFYSPELQPAERLWTLVDEPC